MTAHNIDAFERTLRQLFHRIVAGRRKDAVALGYVEAARCSFRKVVADSGSPGQWMRGSGTAAAAASQRNKLSLTRAIYENIETVLARGIRPTTAKAPPARPQGSVKRCNGFDAG